MKLPSEEFLLPVERYNLAVGPLFAEFRGRFPLDEHSECMLKRSLGIFLGYCFRAAQEQMEKLRPVPLSRDEWNAATPETKAEHMKWQRNLQYLRRRNAHYCGLLAHTKKKADDDPF